MASENVTPPGSARDTARDACQRAGSSAYHTAITAYNPNRHGAVRKTVREFGGLHVLVNNHAEQHQSDPPEALTPARVLRTFQTNVFSFFHLIDAALPHLEPGACILNTSSIVATRGHDTLLDYAASG